MYDTVGQLGKIILSNRFPRNFTGCYNFAISHVYGRVGVLKGCLMSSSGCVEGDIANLVMLTDLTI